MMNEDVKVETKRKRRTDRNHILYLITNDQGDKYVGVTVAVGQAYVRSVKVRFQKHMSRAKQETNKQWRLYEAIRANPNAGWVATVLEIVRGKAAFQREREVIREVGANLNTF